MMATFFPVNFPTGMVIALWCGARNGPTKASKSPHGDRQAVFLAAHAGAFAQPLVRANSTADFGEGVGLAIDAGGFVELPVLDQPQGVGNIIAGRANPVAGSRVRAMDAAGGFINCPFIVEAGDRLVEIAHPFLCRAQRRSRVIRFSYVLCGRQMRNRGLTYSAIRFSWGGFIKGETFADENRL